MATKRKTSQSRKAPVDRTGVLDRAVERGEEVWLAGLGALSLSYKGGRQFVEEDAAKLYRDLVRDGEKVVKQARSAGESWLDDARKSVSDRWTTARTKVDSAVEETAEQAGSGLARVEEALGIDQIFDRRVKRALDRLGYPTPNQHMALKRKVDRLAREEKAGGKAA